MLSTFFLLLLLAFQLWYLTSPQVKMQPVGYEALVVKHPQQARLVGGALLVVAAVLFVLRFGLITGLSAWLVGLMGVGGLVVALAPFRLLSVAVIAGVYVVSLGLELIF